MNHMESHPKNTVWIPVYVLDDNGVLVLDGYVNGGPRYAEPEAK